MTNISYGSRTSISKREGEMRMINGKTKVLKEITIDNCVISFIEQPNKATDKRIDNLHPEIAKFLLSDYYARSR